MIENLFISKVRVKILRAYMSDVAPEYHVRELVRVLDEEVNAVRRELQNLEVAGVLKSRKDGNRIVFSINESCLILPELRSIIRKDNPTVKKIHKMLTKQQNLKIALLTENFFTQNYTSEKDIDMLLIGIVDVNELNKDIEMLEKELGRTIKVALFRVEEFDFRKKNREDIVYKAIRTDKILLLGSESDLLS